MSTFLKEKAKRYIKANYGKCSVNEVAKKFGVSCTAVEEYMIEELPLELQESNAVKEPAQKIISEDVLNWTNRVLIILILSAIGLLIVSLTISQLSNNDVWQHLKNGQMILQTRKFQYADPYSCNAVGNPWINEAWFSGVVFYIMYLLMGVNGIIYLKTFIILLMAGLVALNCYRLNIKFILYAPVVVFMLFNVGVRFLARTEMFSYFFIAAFFLIIMLYKYRRISWRFLLLLPLLQIFWSNMHGSFIVGIFILFIFAISETMRLLINRHYSFWQNDLITWERLKPLYIVSLVTVFACIINPYGLRLFIQPFYVVFHKSEYIKTIYEWQSPFASATFKTSYAFNYYMIWMFLLGLSFIADIKRTDLTNLSISLFFGIMAAKMHRNITIFTIATCPIMCLNFQQAGQDFIKIAQQKLKYIIDLACLIIILGILIPLIFISFKNGYIYRKGSSKPFGLGVASNMPIKSTAYIMKNHIKGCCFNSYTYGTYLIFHCFPDTRVTMDSRAEHVYGERFYQRHQRALYDVNIFKGILKEFDISYILLKYQSGDLTKHCEYLDASGEWAMVYFDDAAFLYVRRLPEYADLIARDEYKYLHPLLTMKQSKIPKKDIDGYIKECERNLVQDPEAVLPHIILLNLYSSKGDWEKAIKHGEFVLASNPRNYAAYMIMGLSYSVLKEHEKAEAMYRGALKINPGSKEAQKALMQLEKSSKI